MIFSQARESNEKRTSEKFRPQEKKKSVSGLLWMKAWKLAVYILHFVVYALSGN